MDALRDSAAAVLLVSPVAVAGLVAPRIVLAFVALVLFPGYALLGGRVDGAWRRAMTAVAAGAALLAVAVYTASALGIPVTRYTLGAYVLVAAAAYLYRRPWTGSEFLSGVGRGEAALAGVAMLGVVTRLGPVAGMHAPLFADPAVEGTLARLIAMTGGLPGTWEPFAPLALHHQPGFASVAAALHLVSGVAIPRVVLVLSALVHALFPLAVFLLADTVLERRTAVVAGGVALLAAFPTYSFVAGMNSANLAFLLGVVLAAVSLPYCRTPDSRLLPLLAVLATGTMLVHPLGLVVAGVLLLPAAVRTAAAAWRAGIQHLRTLLALGGTVFLLPFLLSLPHYLPVLRQGGVLALEQFAIQSAYILPGGQVSLFHLVEPFYVNVLNWWGGWYVPPGSAVAVIVSNPLGTLLLAAAAVAMYRGYRRCDIAVADALAWYVVLFLASTVQAAVRLPFPGHAFIYPSRMKFLFAIPIAVLSAYGLRDVTVEVRGRAVPALLALFLLLSPVALLAVGGYLSQLAAVPVVADADRDAIRWLERNADEEAVVLNTLADVEAGAFVGGPGQWIPAYTGNPVVFPATSITGDVASMQDRRRVMAALRNGSSERFRQLLDEYNVSYIYLSENSMDVRGQVPAVEPEAVQELCGCPVAYGNAEVTILKMPRTGWS